MGELRFHFRNPTAADIPPGKLKVNGEIGLRPTSFAPKSADGRSNQISMCENLHAAKIHSAIVTRIMRRFWRRFRPASAEDRP
jgi:hypothetical protein